MNAFVPHAGERLLADAIRRAQRGGNQRLLKLDLEGVPALRPHHRRIARSLLQEAASRHGGQLFPMSNGDLALLAPEDGADPGALRETFGELFKAASPHPDEMVAVWNLEQDQGEIFRYLQSLLSRPPVPPIEEELPAPPSAVDAVAALLASPSVRDLAQRQMAIEIVTNRTGQRSMRPLFREISFSVEALEGRLAAHGRASGDPYLFRHLAARLDPRMMALVGEELAASFTETVPIHLNLAVETLLSDAFPRFAAGCRERAQRPGIEVSLIEAARAPEEFAVARKRIRAYGFSLSIEGITPLALSMANPASFAPDFVKLDWEKPLAERPELMAAVSRIGPERIVLQKAQSEAAVEFGFAHGITRFQGRHIDSMLAAARLKACPYARQCTLRQCAERAAASSPATRRFCFNPGLLDRGLPEGMASHLSG